MLNAHTVINGDEMLNAHTVINGECNAMVLLDHGEGGYLEVERDGVPALEANPTYWFCTLPPHEPGTIHDAAIGEQHNYFDDNMVIGPEHGPGNLPRGILQLPAGHDTHEQRLAAARGDL